MESGWEDNIALMDDTVSRKVMDDTLPGGAGERRITCEAPLDRCDSVGDAGVDWEVRGKHVQTS